MKKKITIIAMLASLLIASCSHEVDNITPAPTDATPLRIGQIGIAHTAAELPSAGGTTRIDIDEEAFATDDEILVTANCFPADADAPAATPSQPVSTIYSLTDAGWQLAPDADAIIAQHIDPATPITIQSWGGRATWSGSIDYTNQRTAEAYRLNNLLLCPAATLTAATLSGTLAHSRVDVVLRVADAYRYEPLPTAATFTLKGATGKDIHTWRQGKSGLITTFRACIDPADVPATMLGTLAFRAHGSSYTARISYTLTPADAQVEAGMRMVIDVDYTQPEDPTPPAPTEYEVKATAKVTPWKNIDGGDAGTTGTGSSTGLDNDGGLSSLTADNPVWVITGNDPQVLTNVKTALDALNNNPAARIHLMLTGFAGDITGYAFSGCTGLASISAPAATSIGSGAFSGCKALTTISLPAAKSIGGYAFSNCDALTSFSLPVATSIGNNAFEKCDALTTISLPAATRIGNNAFENCTALTRLELTGTEAITVDKYAFGINSSNTTGNITLVLNSKAQNQGNAMGITVNGKAVTFNTGSNNPGTATVTLTFAAIEYITIN